MTPNERNAHIAALLHAPLGILVILRSIKQIGSDHFDELSAERLYEIAVGCVLDLSPHASDYLERIRELLARGPSLQYYAEQLLDAPAAADWFANLDRRRQTWISLDSRPPPGPTGFRPDLRPFGGEVPKPHKTVWTSTSVGHYPSGWIPYLRWGEDHRAPPYHPWRLEVLPVARVYEIQGPEAWQALCLAYPSRSPGSIIIPNWEKAAHDWDGVHLSAGGLLTAQGVSRGEPEAQSRLAGWDVECTTWFRWAFGHVERLRDTS